MSEPASRIAVCLNSSFLGFYAHAGFLAALIELGIRPAALSGASAGALVAGLFAAGVEPERVIELLLHRDLRNVFWEFGAPWRSVATIANLPGHTGAISGRRALALLKKHIGDRRIEECVNPRVAIATTNLTTMRTELATRGPLAEFMLASGAYPGMFAAREIGGEIHWDGGIANALPFEHWLGDETIGTIIIHSVESHVAATGEARRMRISNAVALSHQIVCDELLRLKVELAKAAGKRLVFMRTVAPRPSVFTAGKIGPRCVEHGRATVAEHREMLAALVADFESLSS